MKHENAEFESPAVGHVEMQSLLALVLFMYTYEVVTFPFTSLQLRFQSTNQINEPFEPPKHGDTKSRSAEKKQNISPLSLLCYQLQTSLNLVNHGL
mmetsp:Transcript_13659/g.33417  ORF Transcript_13659/g.33417 Transcript_13659/m.33417 type:complete len:96 (+) Transcript_13659:253-540(+)